MSASIQTASNGFTTGTTTPTATFGAAPAVGDLLVGVLQLDSTGSTISAANGYTVVAGPDNSSCFFYKVAGASEPAAQNPVTLSGGKKGSIIVQNYSGNIATPHNVSGGAAATGASQTTPTVDPTDAIPVIIVCAATSRAPTDVTWSGQLIGGSASGVTERADVSSAGNCSACLWDKLDVGTEMSTFSGSATPSSSVVSGAAFIGIFQVTAFRSAMLLMGVG